MRVGSELWSDWCGLGLNGRRALGVWLRLRGGLCLGRKGWLSRLLGENGQGRIDLWLICRIVTLRTRLWWLLLGLHVAILVDQGGHLAIKHKGVWC